MTKSPQIAGFAYSGGHKTASRYRTTVAQMIVRNAETIATQGLQSMTP
jgi:hypothetical protein